MQLSTIKITLLFISFIFFNPSWNFNYRVNPTKRIETITTLGISVSPVTQLDTIRDCSSIYRNLSSISKSEARRIEAIRYSLDGVDSGRCFYCIRVVRRLIQKEDLELYKDIDHKITALFRKNNICVVSLIPRLINDFRDTRFEQYLKPLFKKTEYEISRRSIFTSSSELVEKHLTLSTLLSNRRVEGANQSIIEILTIFNNLQNDSHLEDYFNVILSCNPSQTDLIKNLITQCFVMRETRKNLQKNSIDVLYTDFAKRLLNLNTVKEWNDYKREKLESTNTNHKYIYSDWDEDGTIVFLQGLLENGFTIEEK